MDGLLMRLHELNGKLRPSEIKKSQMFLWLTIEIYIYIYILTGMICVTHSVQLHAEALTPGLFALLFPLGVSHDPVVHLQHSTDLG